METSSFILEDEVATPFEVTKTFNRILTFKVKGSPTQAETFNADIPSMRRATTINRISENEVEESAIPKYRRKTFILSMDGGAARGIIPARILWRLEDLIKEKTGETEVNLCDYFDFIAGSSTGAILTTMLTTPDENGKPLMRASECFDFFSNHGREFFQLPWYHPFRGRISQIWRPRYSPRGFERVLQHYLCKNEKEYTLKDALVPVLITCFDIARSNPYFFTRTAAMKDDSHDFRLWEILRGVTAAPTYFPPYSFESMDGKNAVTCIDGGTVQNNPALVALTHVLGHKELYPEAKTIEDVMLLSLGAGQLNETISFEKSRKWGVASWVNPIMNIMMDGTSDTIDYQIGTAFAGQDCSSNYLRIQLSKLPKRAKEYDSARSAKNTAHLKGAVEELLQKKRLQRNAFGEKEVWDMSYDQALSQFADELIAERKERQKAAEGHSNAETCTKATEMDEEKGKENLKAKERKGINRVLKNITSPFANRLDAKNSGVFNRSLSILF